MEATMNKYRNFTIAALVAVFFAAIFTLMISGMFTASAAVGPKPDAVKYLPITSGQYNFDPNHTVIGFSVKHLEIALVEGRFKDLKGSVNFDEKDITRSTVSFSAKIASIDTGVEARNAHLRTA